MRQIKNKIIELGYHFISTTFVFLVLVWIIRLLEFFLFQYYGIHEVSYRVLFQRSMYLDAFFIISASLCVFVPYILLSLRFPKKALTLVKWWWILLLLITLGLTHFFISGQYLLTHILFQFSWEEIVHIIAMESRTTYPLIWSIYLVIPLSIWLLLFPPYRLQTTIRSKTIWLVLYLIMTIGISTHFSSIYKPSYTCSNQFEFYISNNKITHFLRSIILSGSVSAHYTEADVYPAILDVQKEYKEFDFTSTIYPFSHNEPYQNVLGTYFKSSQVAPNIVIILSEGLGSAWAGLHPSGYHLLPFIDSLATQGLYWENFLSNCCRTYGALPNILGSLPPGTVERGFVNFNAESYYGQRYPNHSSLIKELKLNDYFTSFFYGGWGGFDNYQFFMEAQQIDLMVDKSKFDSLTYLPPWKRTPNGFYWGYDDKALFRQWFDYEKKQPISSPYLSIYLTLNMHEPFNLCSADYYEETFIQERLKKLNLADKFDSKKEKHMLGSMFFYEDALKDFFDTYKKRADFNHTIFIIVGDHFSWKSVVDNSLGIYHVPLIIYSPLIKSPTVFKGVSTHLDITPSLLALLQGNFRLSLNQEKHWLGQGLDISTSFRCNRIAPLNMYSSDYPHFIYRDYLVSSDAVYKISNGLSTTLVTDSVIINNTNKFVKRFKTLDYYVCRNNKILK